MKKIALLIIMTGCMTHWVTAQTSLPGELTTSSGPLPDSLCTHKVLVDSQSKIIPWITPSSAAYARTLDLLWNYILTKAPDCPSVPLPMYYLYCGFRVSKGKIVPDTWMNDVGEKIPNWFESARLYYAYTGNRGPLDITKGVVDYSLARGITPSGYDWPHFPETASNAGDTLFRGFNSAKKFSADDVQVDHAGDMGATYFRSYLFYGEERYKLAAIGVADALAAKVRTGDSENSPWPYVVNARTGAMVSAYGTNWFGCITLFDLLIETHTGNVKVYRNACAKARQWILTYPMRNGRWVDGHTDTYITGTGNLSNMSASNAGLYISEHPGFDPDWKKDLPALLRWTDEHFVFNCKEPAIQWGAYTVAEQNEFKFKMGYQTSRYAAQCALWYAASGDTVYKERARRSLSWSTYMVDKEGKAADGALEIVGHWWSDCYGEGPRMYYYAFSALPEWSPPGEDHILYSGGILKDVSYGPGKVCYRASENAGPEYLRLSFRPVAITLDGKPLSLQMDTAREGYMLRDLGQGDYAVTVQRKGHIGLVVVEHKAAVVNNPPRQPEPPDWFTGDIHVHRNCGDGTFVLPYTALPSMMEKNDLAAISVLADMGNGEVKYAPADLLRVNGKDDDSLSAPGRIVHWDAEWHWDAVYSQFDHQALGGHLVLLGLKEAHPIWAESPYTVLEWARRQQAVCGFAHLEYLNNKMQNELNCCIPIDYPVEAALGNIDFVSEDVWANEASLQAYYRLLNCGFRLGLAAGTDYPCNNMAPPGSQLTYVRIPDGKMTYRKWIDGIAKGKTIVSMDGHREFLDLRVGRALVGRGDGEQSYGPGDEVRVKSNEKIIIKVIWTAMEPMNGRIELVNNGKVIARQDGLCRAGVPVIVTVDPSFAASGWLCARRMDSTGHKLHTAPVYITVDGGKMKASKEDAGFFLGWIDNILEKIKPGGPWNKYFPTTLEQVEAHYHAARDIYKKLSEQP